MAEQLSPLQLQERIDLFCEKFTEEYDGEAITPMVIADAAQRCTNLCGVVVVLYPHDGLISGYPLPTVPKK